MAYQSISIGGVDQRRLIKEGEYLLHIFPEELWFTFMEALSDLEILENLSNASPYLRDFLLPKRVLFLFPKFWNIIAVHYHKVNTIDPTNAYQEPSIESFRNQWFLGIIKLRLVCRVWCAGVDAWYQNADVHWKLANDTKSCYDNRVESLCTEQLENYEEWNVNYEQNPDIYFDLTHTNSDGVAIRNPFLGRAVKLEISGHDRNDEELYLDWLRNVLEKYGHYFWYCTIDVQDSFSSRAACYTILRRYLELMPNLKVLFIIYFHSRHMSQSAQELSQLESEIGGNPLPTLGNLQSLKMNLYDCAVSIIQEILRRNQHISMFQWSDSHQNYDFRIVTLSNLKQLSLQIMSEPGFHDLAEPSLNWPLTKLNLDFNLCGFIEWQRVFNLVETKWAETLKNLVILLPWARDSDEENRLLEQCPNLSLNMPRVTHLKLGIKNVTCLDFLLPMTDNLEFLEIHLRQTIREESQLDLVKRIENGKIIKLLSTANRPLDSNIWTLFPKLNENCCVHDVNVLTDGVGSSPDRISHWTRSRQEWAYGN